MCQSKTSKYEHLIKPCKGYKQIDSDIIRKNTGQIRDATCWYLTCKKYT